MAKVDLNANRETLLRAHKEVSDTNNATNWALFGYEGQSNVLKVIEKGDGGFEELIDELNSGKIMYAYCSVVDPNTSLPKYVLINWQGEGVPELKKGRYAHHAADVARLLRGAHVTINARSEDDVDEDAIKEQVSRASGSNYSIHKEKAKPVPEPKPVGSVYQRTVVGGGDMRTSRDAFWDKTRTEEKQRLAEERKRRDSESKDADRERREREVVETRHREEKEAERMGRIRSQREAEKRAETKNTETQKKGWEETQRDAMATEEERRKRSEMMRKQRAEGSVGRGKTEISVFGSQSVNEAQSLISKRQVDPKSAFEQRPTSQFDQAEPTASSRPPPRRLKDTFVPQEEPPRTQAREPSKPMRLPSVEATPPVSPPAVKSPTPFVPSSPPFVPSSPPVVPSSPPAQTTPPSRPSTQPQVRNLLQEALPPRQTSDDEDNDDDDWGDEDNKPAIQVATRPASHQTTPSDEPAASDELYSEAASYQHQPQPYQDTAASLPPSSANQYPEDVYDDIAPISRAPPQEYTEEIYDDIAPASSQGYGQEVYDDSKVAGQISPRPTSTDLGLCARALYDYQATEDNEITFDPDDIITNIDQIDEGWWIGTAPDNSQGMFPANYVELIN